MKKVMISLKNKIELIEKEEITKALEECSWIQARAAKSLGITGLRVSPETETTGLDIEEHGEQGYYI